MGGLVSRRKPPQPPPPPPRDQASALSDDDEPETPVEDAEAVLREREEKKRMMRQRAFKPVPDTITPVRIRERLTNFLDEDFASPQAMQAAIDAYAAEVDLIEREGRMVGRLIGAGSVGSGAPVNEIRRAIESFLDSPAHSMNQSLDETARALLTVDVDLPDRAVEVHADTHYHSTAVNSRVTSVPQFPGQMPRTAASDAAFLKSISSETQLLEAERRVAEQVAETKHQRQQAQLQHHYIQRLIASKKDGEEIEGVLTSAKVIREQKDVLRRWQAEQETLRMLQDEVHDWERQLEAANNTLRPFLASHRTLKQSLDKSAADNEAHEKVIEEFDWLESEERGASSGQREPFTQEESFRLDFLAFKKQSWEDNAVARHQRTETEELMFANIELTVIRERQNVAMIKSELEEAQERAAIAEARCQELCQRSEELGAAFARLPTAKSISFQDQSPDDSLLDRDTTLELGEPSPSLPQSPTAEDNMVYTMGCDTTHGIDQQDLDPGFATEFYYIGEELGESGPDLENVKPDATTTSLFIDLEAPERWPESFPEECVAARWSGFFSISVPGKYTFSTESNDGSRLWVAGLVVVDNGGLHGMRKAEGVAALSAGLHTMKADFFVSSGSPGMIVKMSGPDTEDDNGRIREILVEGYHRRGWESVGAFASVYLEPKQVHAVQTLQGQKSAADEDQEEAGLQSTAPLPIIRQSSRLSSVFGRKDSSASLTPQSPVTKRSFSLPSTPKFMKRGSNASLDGESVMAVEEKPPDAQESRPATKSVQWEESVGDGGEPKTIRFLDNEEEYLQVDIRDSSRY